MKRRFVAITPVKVTNKDGDNFVGAMAVADDGTAWNLVYSALRPANDGWSWVQILDLPDSAATT